MTSFVGQGLTDIDSLALAVRDPESKRLIGESISEFTETLVVGELLSSVGVR